MRICMVWTRQDAHHQIKVHNVSWVGNETKHMDSNAPLEEVQDLGGSQMVLKSPAVKQLANGDCPYGVGAVEKIIPP
jgi:hypothetical protein